jgi:hypothetical protein
MEKHLSLWAGTQTALKQTMYRKVYGTGLPLVLQLDSAARSQVSCFSSFISLKYVERDYNNLACDAQRVLGASHIHRSSLAQDVMNGRDWDIDFEDFLNSTRFLAYYCSVCYHGLCISRSLGKLGPKNSTEILNPVSVMEHQLGML